MIKLLFKSIASFLTIVLGHFLNRRLDRAVLFFSIFVLSVFGYYYARYYLSPPVDDEGYMQWFRQLLLTMASIGLVVLVLSSVVTYFDGRRNISSLQTDWTVSGRIGAVLLSSLGLIGVIYLGILLHSAVNLPAHIKIDTSKDGDTAFSYFLENQFYQSVSFGGDHVPENADIPPAGKGYLIGKIEYDGKPVPGITLEITLNGRYKRHDLMTDQGGQFVLRLPPGKWKINSINSTAWKHKPPGRYVLLSGHEPKFDGGIYHRFVFDGPGLEVNVTGQSPETPQIQLFIHKRISLLNPPENIKPSRLSLDKDHIQWTAYQGAASYQVVLSSITRSKDTTSFFPFAMKVVSDATQLELNQFKTVPRDGKAKEYTVKVIAFDKDGQYLSESDEDYNEHYTFLLADPRDFARVRYPPSGFKQPRDPENSGQIENDQKFSAIETMVKEKMYNPAKRLLDSIDAKNKTSVRFNLLMGYWYANQGQCHEAESYFNKVRAQGSADCVTLKYQAVCSSSAK